MTAVVLRGDARRLPLPDACADLVVTSPPYFGLRSYTDGGGHYDGQIGSEASPGEWVAALVACTAEWVRVLKPSGSIYVNLGDKYAQDTERSRNGLGSRKTTQPGGLQSGGYIAERTVELGKRDNGGIPRKSLLGLPWRYALACMDELGLILRRDIIWSKPNGLPESVTDRCRSSHEYLFHFTVRPRYYAAVDEIREPHDPDSWRPSKVGRTSAGVYHAAAMDRSGSGYGGPSPLGKLPGSVWEIASQPLTVPAHLGVDHFAAFPMELPRRVILGWSPPGICTECGEGRRPVVDKTLRHKQYVTAEHRARMAVGVAHGRSGRADFYDQLGSTEATITGYACACPAATAPVRPAVVVDPFGGTGTTALVASMLGRTGISVDLSADYCRLARWRTTDPAERARALQVPKPPPVPDGQGSLFDEAS